MTRRFLVVALAALTLGCQQSPTVPKLDEQPIALTMTFKTTTFQAGRADTIIVTATSAFDQGVTLLFNSDCQILVTIRTTTGNVVVPQNGVHNCTPIATSLDIPALGSVSRTFVWTGATQFTPPGSATSLPAGSYFVSAAINATNYSTIAPAVLVELTTP